MPVSGHRYTDLEIVCKSGLGGLSDSRIIRGGVAG